MTWPTVHTQLANHGVQNVLRLLDLILCFPPTSVANECTFSAMKLCKGKRRGRMKTTTLNDLLTIQLQSKSIQEFDPDKAIKLWMKTPTGQQRRLNYTRRTPVAASLNTHYAEPIDVEVLDSNEGVEEEPQVSVSDIPEVENEVEMEVEGETVTESDTESDSDSDRDNELTELEVERELERI